MFVDNLYIFYAFFVLMTFWTVFLQTPLMKLVHM